MTGSEIKALILNSGLKCWQVAYEWGISDGNFSRRLRRPFNDNKTKRVQEIIKRLKENGGDDNA